VCGLAKRSKRAVLFRSRKVNLAAFQKLFGDDCFVARDLAILDSSRAHYAIWMSAREHQETDRSVPTMLSLHRYME
jgi:hypothetical protein